MEITPRAIIESLKFNGIDLQKNATLRLGLINELMELEQQTEAEEFDIDKKEIKRNLAYYKAVLDKYQTDTPLLDKAADYIIKYSDTDYEG